MATRTAHAKANRTAAEVRRSSAPGPAPDPTLDPALAQRVADGLEALDGLDEGFDALDASAADGFLSGVLLQPHAVPVAKWLPWIVDGEGRDALARRLPAPLAEALRQRHRALRQAIDARRWFDPWVFAADGAPEVDGAEADDAPSAAVAPWVTGFALAMEVFPQLEDGSGEALVDALALLYRHLDPDDLEDDAALQDAIDALEPPQTLDEAVEDLVQAVMLAADVRDAMGHSPSA